MLFTHNIHYRWFSTYQRFPLYNKIHFQSVSYQLCHFSLLYWSLVIREWKRREQRVRHNFSWSMFVKQSNTAHALLHIVTHEFEQVLPGILVLLCPYTLEMRPDWADKLWTHQLENKTVNINTGFNHIVYVVSTCFESSYI